MTAEIIEANATAIEKKIESICTRMKRMTGSQWSDIMRELHEVGELAGTVRRDAHGLVAYDPWKVQKALRIDDLLRPILWECTSPPPQPPSIKSTADAA